jgi:hypothetical protein
MFIWLLVGSLGNGCVISVVIQGLFWRRRFLVRRKSLMGIADIRYDKKKACSKCGSRDLSTGQFDPEQGSVVKCNDCGNVSIINHKEYDDRSREDLEYDK